MKQQRDKVRKPECSSWSSNVTTSESWSGACVDLSLPMVNPQYYISLCSSDFLYRPSPEYFLSREWRKKRPINLQQFSSSCGLWQRCNTSNLAKIHNLTSITIALTKPQWSHWQWFHREWYWKTTPTHMTKIQIKIRLNFSHALLHST